MFDFERRLGVPDCCAAEVVHQLETHQVARGAAPDARLVAGLYKHDPPLLRAEGDQCVITNDGRRWLAEHPVS